MPRVSYVTSKTFISGEQSHSPENECIDLCERCISKASHSVQSMRDLCGIPVWVPGHLIENSGEEEHPPYDGWYRCFHCGRPLCEFDN